ARWALPPMRSGPAASGGHCSPMRNFLPKRKARRRTPRGHRGRRSAYAADSSALAFSASATGAIAAFGSGACDHRALPPGAARRGMLRPRRGRQFEHGDAEGRTMTEAEWSASADPQEMLAFLRGKASDRKLRLFACACCRHVWDRLLIDWAREAVEASERAADGLAEWYELEQLRPPVLPD